MAVPASYFCATKGSKSKLLEALHHFFVGLGFLFGDLRADKVVCFGKEKIEGRPHIQKKPLHRYR